jgi:hypothetical protein
VGGVDGLILSCDLLQDLIGRLLERKPARRIGMLNGRAADIKKHRWFDGFSWAEMEARRNVPPRKPQESDVTKRIRDLAETERRAAGKVCVVLASTVFAYLILLAVIPGFTCCSFCRVHADTQGDP